MVEVILDGLSAKVDEATIQNWFFEEGDPINEGDDLVELSTEEGTVTIQAPASGILAEVYYDESEIVAKGEVLCTIDNDESDEDEDEEDEEDEDDEEEEDEEEEDDEEDEEKEEEK